MADWSGFLGHMPVHLLHICRSSATCNKCAAADKGCCCLLSRSLPQPRRHSAAVWMERIEERSSVFLPLPVWRTPTLLHYCVSTHAGRRPSSTTCLACATARTAGGRWTCARSAPSSSSRGAHAVGCERKCGRKPGAALPRRGTELPRRGHVQPFPFSRRQLALHWHPKCALPLPPLVQAAGELRSLDGSHPVS